MKKVLLATVAAVVMLVLPAAGAHAVEDPYEDGVCSVSVSPTRVVSGENFTVTVTSDSPRDLSASYNGQTQSVSAATTLTATFRAQATSTNQTAQVTASCGDQGRVATIEVLGAGGDGEDPGGSGGGNPGGENPGGPNPGGGSGDGAGGSGSDLTGSGSGGGGLSGLLPDTGGPAWWLMIVGLIAVLTGAAVAVRRRA